MQAFDSILDIANRVNRKEISFRTAKRSTGAFLLVSADLVILLLLPECDGCTRRYGARLVINC